MSGSLKPRKRENPETELHHPRNHPQGAARLPSVLPAPSKLGWGERWVGGQAPPSYFIVPRTRLRTPETPPARFPCPCPVLPSDPPPPVPSHLTWLPHLAHSPTQPNQWGGPITPPPQAHWRVSLRLPAPLMVASATLCRELRLQADSRCFEKTYKQIPRGRPSRRLLRGREGERLPRDTPAWTPQPQPAPPSRLPASLVPTFVAPALPHTPLSLLPRQPRLLPSPAPPTRSLL